MNKYEVLKEFASKLNGRLYRNEITKEEELYAKQNGIVVVFGASDDLVKLRGAICDEISSWEGSDFRLLKKEILMCCSAFIDKLEGLREKSNILEKLVCEYSEKLIRSVKFFAKYDEDKDYIWTFEMDKELKHFTFDIINPEYETKKFCKGLVFYSDDCYVSA